ncbi:MAG: hypothetical protein HC945_01965 [Nitrosarchaeum sp.]|nr:hypothetical protein [Nitrosarchaeum sp.]
MVSRYLIHKTMIKIVKEIIFIISKTSGSIRSEDVSEVTLTQIQQGVFDIATYTQKLFAVASKDSEVERSNKEHFEKVEKVIEGIGKVMDEKRAEPRLRRDLEQLDEDVEQMELEEYEELKSDWRIETHLKEVIDKLEVYHKGYLQFYATKKDELAILMREIALHMTAVLKLLDIDIREDREIMMHLKHAHEIVRDATPPQLEKVWDETGQKSFIHEVIQTVNQQIEQEARIRRSLAKEFPGLSLDEVRFRLHYIG